MNNLKAIMKQKVLDPTDEVKPGLLKKKPGFGKVKAADGAVPANKNLFARLTGK